MLSPAPNVQLPEPVTPVLALATWRPLELKHNAVGPVKVTPAAMSASWPHCTTCGVSPRVAWNR